VRITKTTNGRIISQHPKEKGNDMNRRTDGRLRGWFSWALITIAALVSTAPLRAQVHDTTLKGNGTNASPLGVNIPLALNYNSCFFVCNIYALGVTTTLANTNAVSGSATSGTGVVGTSSSTGNGVSGTSVNGYGVSGISTYSAGVYGQSTAGSNAGVYGYNSSPAGTAVYGQDNSNPLGYGSLPLPTSERL
jgi:hypothetical protein